MGSDRFIDIITGINFIFVSKLFEYFIFILIKPTNIFSFVDSLRKLEDLDIHKDSVWNDNDED